MRFLLAGIAVLTAMTHFGQIGGEYDVDVFSQDSLTTGPIFPGCANTNVDDQKWCTEYSIVQHVVGNTRYPKECRDADIQGTVYVAFRIDEEGFVKDQQCIRGVYHSLDSSACATIGSLPKFVPGTIDGKPVNSEFICPVRFVIK